LQVIAKYKEYFYKKLKSNINFLKYINTHTPKKNMKFKKIKMTVNPEQGCAAMFCSCAPEGYAPFSMSRKGKKAVFTYVPTNPSKKPK
jgi:hypothetical protein